MFFPGDVEKKEQIYRNGHHYLQNIPAQISSMSLEKNIKFTQNETTKVKTQSLRNDSIIKPSEILNINETTTQPLVLLCVNMVQNGEIIIISVRKTTEINENVCPAILPESHSNIYQLLQNIQIMCKRYNQLLAQQAITRGNNCQNSLDMLELSPTLKPVRTNKINAKYLQASDKLSKLISSEYEMTRCFHIYNEIFTEFVKTFAVMYSKLTNMFLTKHKNMLCFCFHNWYFRNLSQGYVLKCVLKNEQINALNVINNLYYIIITKGTSSTKIDIFFKFQDGKFTIYNDSQECTFTRHTLLNKENVNVIESVSSINTRNAKFYVSNNELVYVDRESDECGDLNTTVSSLSLPKYPSQSTVFEEELMTWHQSIEEPENGRQNKDNIFEYPNSKHSGNDIYINIWCGIQELTESLRNFTHSTHEIVYRHISCTISVLSRFDIFNEEIFEMTSIDNFFKHNSKYIKLECICKPLLQTLADTLLSYVL